MARDRLTSKTAEDWIKSQKGTQAEAKGSGIDNDPAAMNNPDHEKNDPKLDAYAKGDPSAWAEDVDKSNLWKQDKRNEMHVPEMTAKQAAEAVAAAKKLEEKAIKCIVASQRMLPNAGDDLIEAQAADLMHLPENCINATLSRQEKLAQLISKAAADSADEGEDEEAGKSCDAKDDEEEKEEEVEGAKEEKEEEVEAAEEGEEDETEKMAAAIVSGDMSKLPEALQKAIKEKQEKAKGKKEETPAEEDEKAAAEETPKEETPEEETPEEEETSKEASLLDEIFKGVTSSDNKIGAKTLKGLVKKQASEGKDGLNGIWQAPPDVSGIFK